MDSHAAARAPKSTLGNQILWQVLQSAPEARMVEVADGGGQQRAEVVKSCHALACRGAIHAIDGQGIRVEGLVAGMTQYHFK